jgi:hypothetical protein
MAYYWNKHDKTKETLVRLRGSRRSDKYYQDADGYSGTPAAPTTC